MWFALAVAGFATGSERMGVTSFVRSLSLKPKAYDSMLRLFHSWAVDLDSLSKAWLGLVLKVAPSVVTENGRICVVGDRIKCSKSGRRMPAVKCLHQSSDSNTKPEFIMGHSLQALGLLCKVGRYAFCVPIIARIHEGIVLRNADKRTQIDRMILMVMGLLGDAVKANVILDARYCSGKSAKGLVAQGHHPIVRCKKKTVGYLPPEPEAGPQKAGPSSKIRGEKVRDRPPAGHARYPHEAMSVRGERPFGRLSTHRWMSDPAQGLPAWICFSWRYPVTIGSIELIFDSGMHRLLTLSMADGYTERMLWGNPQPETARDYLIETNANGPWNPIHSERNKYQQHRIHKLATPATTSSLRILFTDTNGIDHARLFEARIYSPNACEPFLL